MSNDNYNEVSNTDKLLTLLITDVKRVENKIDKLNDEIVTKDDCKRIRESCNKNYQLKKNELSLGKLTGYAAIITATFAGIAGIIKLFIG